MTETVLQVSGRSIFTRESQERDPAFPPLVCIHGNLGSGRWFRHLLDAYPGRVVAPDMPNFAQSDPIDECSMAAYADWIRAICDDRGIERAVVLGHSLGGAVAMELLATHPKLVERLILVDSSPIDGLVTPKEHYPLIEAYKADKAILAQALRAVVPTIADETYFAELVDDAWKMNRECFIGHAQALAEADFTARLAEPGVPVYVLRGAKDILITDAQAQRLAEVLGGSCETMDSCGHSPMVEVPEEFSRRVVELIREGA